jgi:mercuric ion transport protein
VLALFASTGTLVCCALPILLVTLGAGATVAAFTSSFPFVVALSENKLWVFLGSGVLLAGAAWLNWRPGRSCPPDPALGALCETSLRWNRRILLTTAAVWSVGFFAAFLLYPLVRWWDGL